MDHEMRRRVVQLMDVLTEEIDGTTPAGKALAASIEAVLMAMDAYMAEKAEA